MAKSVGTAINPANVATTRGNSGSQTIVNVAASTVPNRRNRPTSSALTVASGILQDHSRYPINPTSVDAISRAR